MLNNAKIMMRITWYHGMFLDVSGCSSMTKDGDQLSDKSVSVGGFHHGVSFFL